MRYVAAYLLAVLGGNNNPSAKDIKNILGSVGIEADDERLNKVDLHLNITDLFIIQLLNTVVLNTGLQYLPSGPFSQDWWLVSAVISVVNTLKFLIFF